MSRRNVLAAVELALTASALVAATFGLVRASYDPYAAVEWVPIVAMGLATAAAISVTAAMLFVGRAALLVSGDAAHQWLQDRRLAAELTALPPPAGRPMPAAEEIAEQRARADAEEQQHAEAMAAVAAEPMQPQTIGYTAVMPTVTGISFGFSPHGAGVVEPEQQPWTAPVSASAGRHAAAAASDLSERAAYEFGGAR